MKVVNGFFKWLATLVFSISAVLLVIILLATRPSLDYFWLRLSMLAAVAFIGSLTARLLFRRLPGIFLFLIAFLTEILALLVVDHFYDSTYRFTFLTHNLTFQMPVVPDGAQGLFMFIIALPTLFFLRRRKKTPKVQRTPRETASSQPAAQSRPSTPQITLSQRVQPVLSSINPGNWQVTKDISNQIKGLTFKQVQPTKAKKSTSAKSVRVNSGSTAKSGQAPLTIKPATTAGKKKTSTVKTAGPRRSKRKQLNDVKLTGEEEHVCPYCLEKVEKSDEIVICPECGTWHHKDCWDLTGSCGVAHRNEL
jgi:ribosomal protein L37AE/L43A